MGRRAGRSPEDTRRAILDAAASSLVERGRSTSLADVARSADVTKGGLLYHFASKAELLVALARDCNELYEREWLEQADPLDDRPGRLLRAYVRVSFQGPGLDDVGFMHAAVVTSLMRDPESAAVFREFADRMAAMLADDGLPAAVVDLVVAAADGAALQSIWGGEMDQARSRDLERRLLAMTEPGD